MRPIDEITALVGRFRFMALLSGTAPDHRDFMDQVYVDQSARFTTCGAYSFFAIDTPYGIKMRDREFAERIQAVDSTATALVIARAIERDDHLHEWIRYNLLDNLLRVARTFEQETP